MIAILNESQGAAFGFKVVGELTAADIAAVAKPIETAIAANTRKPLGVLADLTDMQGASLVARWDEMRFLRQHSDFIARLAIVSDDEWEGVAERFVVTAGGMQAETRYFQSSEMAHAWHWVKMGPADHVPARIIHPSSGLFGDYTPEYVGF